MIFLFNWVISGSMLILQGVSESSGMKLRTQFTRLTIPVNSSTFNREPCHLTSRLFHPVDVENDGCPCKERTLRGLEIGDMPPQIFQWNYETLSGVAAISAFQIKQDFATKSLILADIPPAPKWGCWLLTDPRCWFTLQACPMTFSQVEEKNPAGTIKDGMGNDVEMLFNFLSFGLSTKIDQNEHDAKWRRYKQQTAGRWKR